MEETTPTIDELQKQINDLKAAETARMEEQQAAAEQIRTQLQNVTGAAITTMGSIEQAKALLAEQQRERYQLEGMLRMTMNSR